MKEAVVTTRRLLGLRLSANHAIGGEREARAMEKAVVLETTTTEQRLIGMESFGTRERSNVWAGGEVGEEREREREREGERDEAV